MQPINIEFPAGLRVDCKVDGFDVRTDQPVSAGGEGSAPGPFDYFLASIGSCAGYYVLRFLRGRGISSDGVRLALTAEKDPKTGRLASVHLGLELPEGFPRKYEKALLRAIDQCPVKRSLLEAPRFETEVRSIDSTAVA